MALLIIGLNFNRDQMVNNETIILIILNDTLLDNSAMAVTLLSWLSHVSYLRDFRFQNENNFFYADFGS